MLWTRRALGRALGLAVAAPALTACTPFPRRSDPVTQRPRPAGEGYRLRPVDEALWVCGEDGLLWALDGRTDTVSARLPLELALPKLSAPVLYAGPVLWAYEFQTGAVVAVDPAGPRIVGRTAVPSAADRRGLASIAAHDALWIFLGATAFRVDPVARPTSAALPAGFSPETAVATARWIWVAGDGRLVRIDPAHPASAVAIDLPDGVSVGELVAGPAALYAVSADRARTWALDVQNGRVLSTWEFDEAASALYPVDDDLWVVGDTKVRRVRSGKAEPPITAVAEPEFMDSSALFDGAVWGGVVDQTAVVRFDLAAGRVAATIPVEVAEPEDPAFAVYAGKHALWVLDGDFYNGISRIDPLSAQARKVVPTTAVTMWSAVAAPPPVGPAR